MLWLTPHHRIIREIWKDYDFETWRISKVFVTSWKGNKRLTILQSLFVKRSYWMIEWLSMPRQAIVVWSWKKMSLPLMLWQEVFRQIEEDDKRGFNVVISHVIEGSSGKDRWLMMLRCVSHHSIIDGNWKGHHGIIRQGKMEEIKSYRCSFIVAS